MTDDQSQLGFEIEFDDQTQSWLEWSDPDHMESAIRTLLRETVPGIADYSDLWWQPPLSTRIIEAARVRFESWDGFLAPENHSNADQFIRFVGECIRRQHPEWCGPPASSPTTHCMPAMVSVLLCISLMAIVKSR